MKKIISALLAVVMLLGIMPSALAAPTKDELLDPIMNGEGSSMEFINDPVDPWTVVDYLGTQYVRSNIKDIHGVSTSITATTTVQAGSVINFDYMVSTEFNYDILSFGYRSSLEPDGVTVFEASGDTEGTFSYLIKDTMEYTFFWTYTKDSSMSDGRDCVYLRNVTFTTAPAATSFNIVEDELSVVTGTPKRIMVEFSPEGTYSELRWSSSNPEVATVEEGIVTGLTSGTTTITARLGEITDSIEVSVVSIEGAKYLEGFRVWSELGYSLGHIRNYMVADNSNVVIDLPFPIELSGMMAAEYYDGIVYTVANSKLYAVDYETNAVSEIGMCGTVIDITYDYAGQRMLGIRAGATLEVTDIFELNLETAEVQVLSTIDLKLLTIAAAPNGDIYSIVNEHGQLVKLDVNAGTMSVAIETGVNSQNRQSMTFDQQTGLLYWVCNTKDEENLYKINVTEGTVTEIHHMLGVVIGLYMPTIFDETAAVTGVLLDKTNETMEIGEQLTLTATVMPVNATNQNVTWTTSNEAVATVENGVVTAVAEGTATITVTTEDGGFTANCEITVNGGITPPEDVAVEGVTLDIESATMIIGDTLTLTATVMPEDATNKNVVWTSSNEEVATVENGVVTAVAYGEATITVMTEDGEFTATCVIKVYAMGDVTGDGMFNTGDAVAMLRKIAGLDNSNYVELLEDYNADGQFNTGDAVAILRKIAGLA